MPAPDVKITQLEDKLLKDMAMNTSMARLSVSGSGPALPLRPSYGNKGKEVTLWANYFRLEIKTVVLYKYTLEVTKVPEEGTGSGVKIPEPKGRKLERIIGLGLPLVGEGIPIVSEYKSKIVSTRLLELPSNKTIAVPYTDEGRNSKYEIKFVDPTEVSVGDLLSFLSNMQNPSASFPVFADVIDAIGIVLGHYPRAHDGTASLGSSRHFPLSSTSETKALEWPDFNDIIRGYFQSVRPATGRLLLNSNVSHGVFRFSGPITQLMQRFNLNAQDGLKRFDKTITRVRAKVQVLIEKPPPGSKAPKKANSSASKGPAMPAGVARIKESVICGLADPRDGSGDDRPKVHRFGAHPAEVTIVINAPAPHGFQAGRGYTVAEYFRIRKYATNPPQRSLLMCDTGYKYEVSSKLPLINTGTKKKPVYLPAELVEIIPGQALRRKTTPDETRQMIEFSCRSPFANATSIVTKGRSCLGLDNSPWLVRIPTDLLFDPVTHRLPEQVWHNRR